jgi:hypothetical protein
MGDSCCSGHIGLPYVGIPNTSNRCRSIDIGATTPAPRRHFTYSVQFPTSSLDSDRGLPCVTHPER